MGHIFGLPGIRSIDLHEKINKKFLDQNREFCLISVLNLEFLNGDNSSTKHDKNKWVSFLDSLGSDLSIYMKKSIRNFSTKIDNFALL